MGSSTIYFFVDKDGTENCSNEPPYRHETEAFWVCPHIRKSSPHGDKVVYDNITELPNGTIKQLFNVKLTWDDEPIKLEFERH